jgi:hypothetical protein
MHMAVNPLETDPPLVVDPNAVPAHSLPRKLLEPITGRHPKVVEGLCGVEDYQFPQRGSLQVSRKSPYPLPFEDPSRLGIPKALDHRRRITLLVNNVKR